LKLQDRHEQLPRKKLGRITEDADDESEAADDDNFILPSEDREKWVSWLDSSGAKRPCAKKCNKRNRRVILATSKDQPGTILYCVANKKRRGTALVLEAHESVRDSYEAVVELLEREEAKAKVLGCDRPILFTIGTSTTTRLF
jgi:hypothetical protein